MRNFALVSLALALAACGGSSSSSPPPSGGGAGGGGSPATSSSGDSSDSTSGEAKADGNKPESAASGAAPEKMDGALPETKDAKPFPRRHECPKTGCNQKLVVPDTLKVGADDKSPVVMWEEVMPPKTMMLFPRVATLDLYGVLLDGEVSVMADDIKDKQKRAWKLNGFRAPGVGVNIYSKEPTRILFFAVVNGTSGTVAEQIAKIEGKDKSIAWTKRTSPVTSFELSQKNDVSWAGGAYHVRYAYEEAPASFELLMMSKNAPVAEHTHDKEWEFLAIVEGDGEMKKKTGNDKVAGSTLVSIAPGTPHSFKPNGSAPTIAFQMYWPPGPEQRFKKLAEGSK